MRILSIEFNDTYPLRHSVLRPHQPLSSCRYPGDDQALHLGVVHDGRLAAILSAYDEDESGKKNGERWRLRGVATDPAFRRRGFAAALLGEVEQEVRALYGRILWCNARTSAAQLYRQCGYVPVSDCFEIAGIGPHYRMEKFIA